MITTDKLEKFNGRQGHFYYNIARKFVKKN